MVHIVSKGLVKFTMLFGGERIHNRLDGRHVGKSKRVQPCRIVLAKTELSRDGKAPHESNIHGTKRLAEQHWEQGFDRARRLLLFVQLRGGVGWTVAGRHAGRHLRRRRSPDSRRVSLSVRVTFTLKTEDDSLESWRYQEMKRWYHVLRHLIHHTMSTLSKIIA